MTRGYQCRSVADLTWFAERRVRSRGEYRCNFVVPSSIIATGGLSMRVSPYCSPKWLGSGKGSPDWLIAVLKTSRHERCLRKHAIDDANSCGWSGVGQFFIGLSGVRKESGSGVRLRYMTFVSCLTS